MIRAALLGFAAGAAFALAFCAGVILLDRDMPDPMEDSP